MWLQQIKKAMGRVSVQTLIQQELQEARMALLAAHTGLEWAESSVAYNTARVKRLEAYPSNPSLPEMRHV